MKKHILVSCHQDSYENKYKTKYSSVIARDYNLYPIYESWGIPTILSSVVMQDDEMDDLVKHYDWVLIYGWMDIDPIFYNQEVVKNISRYEWRDQIEIQLIHSCIRKKVPLFGICRGMQLINVALGGSLYQDIPFQCKLQVTHDLTRDDHSKLAHYITCNTNSFVHIAVGKNTFLTNSFHHQAICNIGEWLQVVARSSDDVVEAIEHHSLPIAGTQRHPEFNYHCNNESKRLFDYIINEFF